MSAQSSKYRSRDHKRRESLNHRDYGYYMESSRRRYDHDSPDGRRRHYSPDDRSRHNRYQERDHHSQSRNSRTHRAHWRTYHYDDIEDDDDDDYYGEGRGYRASRYDDSSRHRRSSYRYEEREKYDRSERYDRYRRGDPSYSPHTPLTDRRSPGPKRPHVAAPPLPPSDANEPPKVVIPTDTVNKKLDTPVKPPEPPKKVVLKEVPQPPPPPPRPPRAELRPEPRPEPRPNPRAESRHAEKPPDAGFLHPDPRMLKNLYATRLEVNLDVVTLPNIAPADATLASPLMGTDVLWDQIKPKIDTSYAPLERLRKSMCTIRPNVTKEWWLKGTHALLMMGIPRQWDAHEVLTFIMESYDRLLSFDDTIVENVEAENNQADPAGRRNMIRWCRSMGLQKFVLLFGGVGNAVNEIPLHYPLGYDSQPPSNGLRRAAHNTSDTPDAMALMIFESEANALQFWTALSSNCIKVYPSAITVCPDPSGWRIYTEAMALWFNGDVVIPPVHAAVKDKKTEDLLSVLTNKNTEDGTQKQKAASQLTFVSPYVANAQDASEIAKDLAKSSVKCMYHKPSKIMSLQFPNESLFSSLTLNHRFFTSPSGARVHCCFVRCLSKFLPLVKRTNVEHISNAVEKSKVTPPKPSKFKPPSVGVITIYNPAAG